MYLIVLVASLLVFCAVTVAFLRSGYFSLFHPFTIYSMFHGLVFVVRPFFSYWLEYEAIYKAYQFVPSASDKITVILAVNLGFLSFAYFCFRHGAVPMRFGGGPAQVAERNLLVRYFPWVIAICAPMAIWSLMTSFSAASQYTRFGISMDRATGISHFTDGTGYFAEAQMMLVPLAALSAWLFRFRLVALAPLAMFVILRAGTGGRGPFVSALFATGLLYLYEKRRRFPTLLVMSGLVAVTSLFSAVEIDRGQAVRALFGEQTDIRKVSDEKTRFMEGMDLGNLEFFEYIVYVVPQRSGTYGYFNDVLQLFTEPVPRALWPGKPLGAPFQSFSMFDYGFPIGYTRSLPGNGWFALGWLGVFITCSAWGYVLGLIYRRFVEGPQNPYQVASYIILLSILIIAYRDGSLVTVFRQGIFVFAPVVVWMGIVRLSGRKLPNGFRRPLPRQEPAGRVRIGEAAALPPAVLRRRQALLAAKRPEPEAG
ncbi:MAG: hypothetical protein U1E37_04925 [Sphingomonadaceae bacterium]